MKILRNLTQLPDSHKGCIIALGNFDGLHQGHQSLINEARHLAKKYNKPAAVMTFEPHPLEILKPDLPPFRLTTQAQKFARLEALGVDVCICLPFTEDFSKLTGRAFIESLLVDALQVSHVVIGYDFIFGYKRSGNAALLKEYGEKHDYGFSQVKALGDASAPFSSTRIRNYLREGKVAEANALLGTPFTMCGEVIRGKQQGRQLGFPTANMGLKNYLHPRYGVYAVTVKIDDTAYRAVANIGIRPTFNDKEPLLEVHLFDFSADLYHKEIAVCFHAFIRDEQAFSDIIALKQQITKDCQHAKEALTCVTI